MALQIPAVLVFALASAAETPASQASADEATPSRGPAANVGELLGLFGVDSSAFKLGAYGEVFYQWNFNHPSNNLTHFRGFDNRHNTFTISNVALDAAWDWKSIVGRLTLQVGHTADTYYASEPSQRGASGTNASGAPLWKFIQQAYVGYRFAVGRGLLLQAGVFLSPIGPEGMAVRDNWNWSRSNLFFGLPYYHTGVRLSYDLSDRWTLTLAGYNGWNSVVDNNDEKSLSLHATYTIKDRLALSLLYFSGVERPKGAPEGRAWRHLFDAHITWQAHSRVQLMLHASSGFEPNAFGTSAWLASALYARVKLLDQLFLSARGDVLREITPAGASALFFPAPWVSSATATLELRPVERVSIRLEYRHDEAGAAIYFRGVVPSDPTTGAFVANAQRQDTLTAGLTTWF